MKEKNINPEPLIQYFEEDVNPQMFLELLHKVMVNYIRCAGRFDGYADIDVISEDIDFLGNLYDVVKEAKV